MVDGTSRGERSLKTQLFAAVVGQRALCAGLFSVCVMCLSGCSALFPVRGEPAECLPLTYSASDRSPKRTINLSLLRQKLPTQHLVDTGDVLGVYIDGVLGNSQTTPPIYVHPLLQPR